MKKKFRFLGSDAEIVGYGLLRCGQVIELPEGLAQEAARGSVVLVPEDIFAALGVSEEDLKHWTEPANAEKRRAAIEAYEQFLAQDLSKEIN